MKRRAGILALALMFPVSNGLAFYVGRSSAPTMTRKLDNERITVTESLTPTDGKREPYTRPTDQLIVFVDEAHYEAVDTSGNATQRHRQPGDLVWHSKGEAAPLLLNKGKAFRNLVISLK
jgi:hypothetical protein